jgi:MFS transporter, OPA family, sugar phosphate sensor protein UhpC
LFARIFILSWLAYCGYYLCRKNFSVLMPFLKTERGYSTQDLANVLFLYSLAYAVGQLLMGSLADRWGARIVVSAGAVVSSLCSVLTATMFPLAISQSVNGLAQASGWPGVLKMTGDWFPAANRGIVMAWWGTHLVAGGFLATTLAAWSVQGDWRRGAWWPAFVLTFVAVTFGALSRDGEGTAAAAGARPRLLVNRALLAIAGMYFFVKMARYSFLFWLPLYMTERLRFTPSDAGYSASIFEVAGFGGALCAGYASERLFRGSRFAVGAVMMAGLSILCVLYPLLSGQGGWANLLGVGLIGAFTFGPDTLMAGPATQECADPAATARAAGFVNGVGSVGQVISPLLVAGISHRFGWDAVFQTLGALALLGGAILMAHWFTQGRKQ